MNAAIIIALLSSCTATRMCIHTSETSVKVQKDKPASTKQTIPSEFGWEKRGGSQITGGNVILKLYKETQKEKGGIVNDT